MFITLLENIKKKEKKWWNPWHWVLIIVGVLLLGFLGWYLYKRHKALEALEAKVQIEKVIAKRKKHEADIAKSAEEREQLKKEALGYQAMVSALEVKLEGEQKTYQELKKKIEDIKTWDELNKAAGVK